MARPQGIVNGKFWQTHALLHELALRVGLVAYEMTMLARRVGTVLTPALIAELQSLLPAT